MKQALQIYFCILLMLVVSLLSAKPANAGTLDYVVKNDGKKVRISLQGLVKDNIHTITLQRCASGISFADLEVISAAQLEAGGYTFIDVAPFYGNNFYRLRLEDTYGEVSYSDIKYARNLEISSKISLYPNPSNGNCVYLKLDACKVSDQIKITIYSKIGIKLKEHIVDNYNDVAGPVRLDIISELHPDIYLIKVESGDISFREQLVINAGR